MLKVNFCYLFGLFVNMCYSNRSDVFKIIYKSLKHLIVFPIDVSFFDSIFQHIFLLYSFQNEANRLGSISLSPRSESSRLKQQLWWRHMIIVLLLRFFFALIFFFFGNYPIILQDLADWEKGIDSLTSRGKTSQYLNLKIKKNQSSHRCRGKNQ